MIVLENPPLSVGDFLRCYNGWVSNQPRSQQSLDRWVARTMLESASLLGMLTVAHSSKLPALSGVEFAQLRIEEERIGAR